MWTVKDTGRLPPGEAVAGYVPDSRRKRYPRFLVTSARQPPVFHEFSTVGS